MDPRVARENSPLEFSVRFNSAPINSAAAREEWTCLWDFDDVWKETGWCVSHYFLPKAKRFRKSQSDKFVVKASFEDSEGKPLLDDTKKPVVLDQEIEIQPDRTRPSRERSWTEGLKLAAALLIAVFGLVAGAQEQLMKLDILPGLIAVFLVGFGADTIKSLLTTKT
jgi:hypothetical protein